MARCASCKGTTPGGEWKWCEPCATQRLRHIMSGGRVAIPGVIARRFARGERVFVAEPVGRAGIIASVRGSIYAVRLDGGGRCHVEASQLKDEDSDEAWLAAPLTADEKDAVDAAAVEDGKLWDVKSS